MYDLLRFGWAAEVRRWGGGRWAGHVQIEYPDGSSFFVLPHELTRAPRLRKAVTTDGDGVKGTREGVLCRG